MALPPPDDFAAPMLDVALARARISMRPDASPTACPTGLLAAGEEPLEDELYELDEPDDMPNGELDEPEEPEELELLPLDGPVASA